MRDTFLIKLHEKDGDREIYLAAHHIGVLGLSDSGVVAIKVSGFEEVVYVRESMSDIFKILKKHGVLTVIGDQQ